MDPGKRDFPGNPDQLRQAIDSGKAGDKIPFPDPAAAPLGTDEEAAGTPVSQDDVDRALAAEAGTGPISRADRPTFRAPAVYFGMILILVAIFAGIGIWLTR